MVSSLCFGHEREEVPEDVQKARTCREGRDEELKNEVVGHRRRAGEAEFSGTLVFGVQCLPKPEGVFAVIYVACLPVSKLTMSVSTRTI